jgi:hypothetical protein
MATNPFDEEEPTQCPWCGESNVPWAYPQIEPVGINEWLCNTCSQVFVISRQVVPLTQPQTSPQGDGDDGRGDRTLTDEDLRDLVRAALGDVDPEKRRPPH